VRALVAELSNTRAAWTVAASKIRHGAAWRRGGVLSLVDIPVPALPRGDGWVRVRPTASGVCGSDLKLLHVTGFSPLLSAYSPSRRVVLGHEVTGVVEAVGPGVTKVAEGDAVLVEPTLRCAHKGLPECRRCAVGEGHLCENLDRAGELCVGQGIGFSDVVGGGWSDGLVAHESMLVAAGGLPDIRAVLAEPASVALHAALRWDRSGDTAVVIGPGSIGLLVTAALRRLHPDLDITVVCAGEFGARQAQAVGATRTVRQPSGAVLDSVAATMGARQIRPRFGKLPVLDGGVDVVFDCVASESTIDLGLRLLRGRGTFVMVGTAGRTPVDWSLVWFRELTLRGAVVYGEEPGLGGRRTFDVMGEWLADPGFPVDGIVTHEFPLEAYAAALETATAGPAAEAVKVVLRPAGT
jgi:threonine dehydrogenase-like Zn-dependent dehydrogenase